MPAKGTTRVTNEQRAAIARGRVEGKPSPQIAKETGLARITVDKQAIDPRTVTLIQQLKAQAAPQLRRMFQSSLNRTEKLIKHPDPVVGLRACRQVTNVLVAGDPPLARIEPQAGGGSGDFTLEELLIVYRRASVSGA